MVFDEDEVVLELVDDGLEIVVVLAQPQVFLQQIVRIKGESSDLLVGDCPFVALAMLQELNPISQVLQLSLLADLGLLDHIGIFNPLDDLLQLIPVGLVEARNKEVKTADLIFIILDFPLD